MQWASRTVPSFPHTRRICLTAGVHLKRRQYPTHRNPLHLTHSSTQINVQNFAGYFFEFTTLINVRARMASKTTQSVLVEFIAGRLSRPTYRQMRRTCPENSAEHPKSAAKFNVLTTLRLKSNRNNSLHYPLPPMSLSISTLPKFIFLDDMQPYGCASAHGKSHPGIHEA